MYSTVGYSRSGLANVYQSTVCLEMEMSASDQVC